MMTPVSGSAADSLRHVMKKNKLTQREVADLCCVHVKTVESWLADPLSAHFRKMPPRHLIAISYGLPGLLGKRKTAANAAKKGTK